MADDGKADWSLTDHAKFELLKLFAIGIPCFVVVGGLLYAQKLRAVRPLQGIVYTRGPADPKAPIYVVVLRDPKDRAEVDKAVGACKQSLRSFGASNLPWIGVKAVDGNRV